jgi:hypothetical protein
MGKIVGWFFSISCLIAGLSFAKNYSETGYMVSLGAAILCFGAIFLLSKATYQATRKVMAATTIILVVTGVLTWLAVGDVAEVFLGLGFYAAWELCVVVLGLPVMAYVFKHDDAQ